MEGFKCRAATGADSEVLEAFMLELQSLEREPIAIPGEDQEAAVRRMLDQGHKYIVEFEGKVIGGAQLLMLDGAGADDRSGFVMMIAIDTGHRRRGFGRQFLSCLKEEARALGAGHLRLNVRSGNVAAKALYANFGFSVMSEFMSKPLTS